MGALAVSDETFLVAPPARVAVALADPSRWLRWWPDLSLRVLADRGAAGLRWTVDGAVTGTMELWLEPVGDGTVVHYFLHADLPAASPATVSREVGRRRRAARAACFELKAELEAGRPPGHPPAPSVTEGAAR